MRQIKKCIILAMLVFVAIISGCTSADKQNVSENTAKEEITAQAEEEEITEQAEPISLDGVDIKKSGTCGDLEWTLYSNGHLTITGNGDYEEFPAWLDQSDEIYSASVDVSGITSTANMFVECSNLKSVDLSNLDTSQVTDMSAMFKYCMALTSIDLSSFDTSQVTNMREMFAYCSELKSLDLSNFVTSQVTDMSEMFRDCAALTSLDISSFDWSKMRFSLYEVGSFPKLFRSCFNLKEIIAPRNTSIEIIQLPITMTPTVWIYEPTGEEVGEIIKAGTYLRRDIDTDSEDKENDQ